MAENEAKITLSLKDQLSAPLKAIGARVSAAAGKFDAFKNAAPVLTKVAAVAGRLSRAIGERLAKSTSAATRRMTRFTAGVRGMARSMVAARKAAKVLGGTLKSALGGVLQRVQGLARLVGTALRIATAPLRILAGGLAVAGVAIQAVGAVLGSLKDAAEKATGATAKGMEQAADSTNAANKSIKKGIEETAAAAQQAQVTFGAFGQVGEGFVQAQGKIADEAGESAKAAGAAAAAAGKDATDSLDETSAAADEAAGSLSDFGQATDRIGSAFTRARDKILAAIAGAIAPALERLADLMESPEFEKFVDLLAVDLANAAAKMANWIADKAIPAIKNFLAAVNAAGGPVEFIKQKFAELGKSVRKVLLKMFKQMTRLPRKLNKIWKAFTKWLAKLIAGAALKMVRSFKNFVTQVERQLTDIAAAARENFNKMVASLKAATTKMKRDFQNFRDDVKRRLQEISDTAKKVFAIIEALLKAAVAAMIRKFNEFKDSVKTSLNTIKENVKTAFNAMETKVKAVFAAMETKAKAVFDAIKTKINSIIDGVKDKFDELKTNVTGIWDSIKEAGETAFDNIVAKVQEIVEGVTTKFATMKESVEGVFTDIKDAAAGAWDNISEGAAGIGTALGIAMEGMVDVVKGTLNQIGTAFENGINSILIGINKFIVGYNNLASPLGLPTLGEFALIDIPELQRGGIANAPTLAVVGDAASPEVIAPLDTLVPLLRAALGAGPGGDIVINIEVPPGITNPQEFGLDIGNGIIQELRRSGLRVPV